MAKKGPTELSLIKLRNEFPLVQKVEYWNGFAKRRIDLFGFIDIVAVDGNTTLGVQCTSDSNVSARVNKIEESEAWPILLDAGWTIQVWGWKKKKGKWEVRIVEMK